MGYLGGVVEEDTTSKRSKRSVKGFEGCIDLLVTWPVGWVALEIRGAKRSIVGTVITDGDRWGTSKGPNITVFDCPNHTSDPNWNPVPPLLIKGQQLLCCPKVMSHVTLKQFRILFCILMRPQYKPRERAFHISRTCVPFTTSVTSPTQF